MDQFIDFYWYDGAGMMDPDEDIDSLGLWYDDVTTQL